MIKHQILIQQVHVVSNENTQLNEVSAIDWRVIAEEQISETEELVVEQKGTIKLPKANSENYIAFDDLSNDTLISWCESSIDFDEIKQSLTTQLEELKNA